MRLHSDWTTAGWDRTPAAPATGPFPRREFLETWWRHRGQGEVLIAETDELLLPLWRDGAVVRIMGEEDLTDYHSPLGRKGLTAFGAAFARALGPGTRFRFDSLPEGVAFPLAGGLAAAGVAAAPVQHEAAAVLDLPRDYDDYLGGLRGKDRHEIRRKGRRFADLLGEPRLVHGPEGFHVFVEMHRAAEGNKGEFMDDAMEGFFRDLLDVDGATLSVLTGGGVPAAAAFGFRDDEGYYLYNSAYAPEYRDASPGVTLVDRLVAASIEGGLPRFDFLKGDEPYKYRMGAAARPLFFLESST
jgi:CelD/BcsL family acetyltransferase involved in cellulose biosynthesis